jgi:hypothetical protein
MAQLTPKNFSTYLMRFQENYLYFATTYAGLYPDLFLDQFVKDQVHVAQHLLGFQYALKVQELAIELAHCSYQIPGYSRRAFISPQLKQYQFSSN